MLTLPPELYTAEQTRVLDRLIIEQHHTPAGTLMARAGTAALQSIKHFWPQAKHMVIVCGSGNNGGDGYELARQALDERFQLSLFEVGNSDKMSHETRAARQSLLATGHPVYRFEGSLPACDVIVDALFGTGLDRPVGGLYADAIAVINNTPATPVLCLDIPSGIDANSGSVLGNAVKASVTLSYIGLNTGLFSGDGPQFCGQICFDNLQAPAHVYGQLTPSARRISLKDKAALLAPRERTGHKGLYGHLLVIGGDNGMAGAARIAAEAGARVGAGLISVATRDIHAPGFNLTRPELMCHGVDESDKLTALLARANVITLGPGLGQNDWGKRLYQSALESGLPMVVDADALNLLSLEPQQHDNWVLTPHPGEAARLLGCTTKQVQADRFSAVKQLHQRYGGVIILKGAGTLIFDGKLPVHLSTSGNPGMASGGMGDALSGIIGGLLAQGLHPADAACLGVCLHGMAADKAAEQDGERGMLAMDLMPHLRQLVNLRYLAGL
jgi:NAD(P)H-hydrate epimerase